jgi:hypothetical protein
MRSPAELGLKHDAESGVARRASPGSIDKFEQQFARKLPADYRTFLMAMNGGCPAVRRLRLPSGYETVVNAFFFVGRPRKRPPRPNEDWDYENLWDETYVAQRHIGDFVIPFATDPFGDYVVFDYRQKSPTVGLAVHDDRFSIVPVAKAFSELLDMLKA